MRIRRYLAGLLAVILLASPTTAADVDSSKDAKIEVRFNLAAIQSTSLGQQLVTSLKAMAAAEIDDDKSPDEILEGVEQALGFDPFEEIKSVTFLVNDIEEPTEDIRGVIRLGANSGNLEGLLIAAPGYDSEDYKKHVVHSVMPDDDMRVFASIHGKSVKHIVFATSQKDVETMLDSLDESPPSLSDDNDGSLVQIQLHAIPDIEDLDGPPKAIVRMIRGASINIREQGDDFEVELMINSDTEKHAEQIQQLAQGAAAMVALANAEDDDEDLAQVAEILKTLEVGRDDSSVALSVRVPESLVINVLRNELEVELQR